MGMFFYVKKDKNEKCPYCDSLLIDNFQTKESLNDEHDYWGGCCNRHKTGLGLLEKEEVEERYYTSCETCKKWIEYKRTGKKYKLTNRDFFNKKYTN